LKKPTTQIKYILYCRKSTDGNDTQVRSLDDQFYDLEKVERRENLKVVEKFGGEKNGEKRTAHKRGRPIFNYMMQQIEAGKANGLLAWHANRIARNAFDGGWVITAMDEGKLLELKTPFRTYYNTPEDKFILQIEFGIAKKSSDDTGHVVKERLQIKANDGWYPALAPLGWLNTKTEVRGRNYIIADPERFDNFKTVLFWILNGSYTPSQAIEKGNKDLKLAIRPTKRWPSARPVSKSTYYRLFTDPFITGWFEYPKGSGNLFRGKHPPMLTDEEFDRLQLILNKKGNPRKQKHRFPFTGLIRCGSCPGMITAEEHIKRQKNGNVHHYVYYRCVKKINPKCPERYIELKELNRQIDAILAGIKVSEDFIYYGIQYYNEIRHAEARTNINILETKQRALVEVNKKLNCLMLKFTSPENTEGQFYTDKEYQALKVNFLKEKLSLENDLKNHGTNIEKWVEKSEQTFQFARNARDCFTKGDWEVKRAILAGLGSNLVLKDQKLALTLHKPYKSIADSLPEVEREIVAARTSTNGIHKGHLALFQARCPTSRSLWDEVRTYFQENGCTFHIPIFDEDGFGRLKLVCCTQK